MFTPAQSGYRQATDVILKRHNLLVNAPHPYLNNAARQARSLFRERLKLALANDQYGNTPNSSFMQFGQFLNNGMNKLRQYDRERALDKERSQQEDPPMSAESLQKLVEFGKAMQAKKLEQIVENSAIWSALMRYADMAAVDRGAAYWQTTLLPLAKRAAGPPVPDPLVEVSGTWRKMSSGEAFTRLDDFLLRNSSEQNLTHVVVEVVAENEWGEKANHYYFFTEMLAGESFRLVPHPRWEKRRLDFVNTINVTYSVWGR